MSQKYALKCSCGISVPVEVRQAGETVTCQCGNVLDVPKLRELRSLEPLVERQQQAIPRQSSWSLLQGTLFVAGLSVLVLAAGSGLYVWSFQRQFDTRRPDLSAIQFEYDITTVSLTDSWQLWQQYSKQKLDKRPTPYHVRARGKVAQLNLLLYFWGILGAIGAVTLGLSFVVRPRR